MFDIQAVEDVLLQDIRPDVNNIEKYDLNGDGELTAEDCPYPAGSGKAKIWWSQIMVPYARSKITEDMRQEYGTSVIAVYKGKPVVLGPDITEDVSTDWLVDKLMVTKGLSPISAERIAAKIRELTPYTVGEGSK